MVQQPGRKKQPAAGGSAEAPRRQDTRSSLGYTRPGTYEELRAVLSSGTINLPKRLRHVAIFLWQHPGDVALGTISPLPRRAIAIAPPPAS
jgi:hypothetical protein